MQESRSTTTMRRDLLARSRDREVLRVPELREPLVDDDQQGTARRRRRAVDPGGPTDAAS